MSLDYFSIFPPPPPPPFLFKVAALEHALYVPRRQMHLKVAGFLHFKTTLFENCLDVPCAKNFGTHCNIGDFSSLPYWEWESWTGVQGAFGGTARGGPLRVTSLQPWSEEASADPVLTARSGNSSRPCWCSQEELDTRKGPHRLLNLLPTSPRKPEAWLGGPAHPWPFWI